MIGLIAKTILKDTYSLGSKWREDKKKTISSILSLTLFLLLALFLYGIILYMSVLNAGPEDAALLLSNGFLAGFFLILVFGTLHLIYSFHYTDDIAMFLTLPVRSGALILGKLLSVMVMESVMAVPVVLVPALVYAITEGATFFFWVRVIVLLFLMIADTVFCVSLLIFLSMRVVNWKKYQDLISILVQAGLMTLAFTFLFRIEDLAKLRLGPMLAPSSRLQAFFQGLAGLVSGQGDASEAFVLVSGLTVAGVLIALFFYFSGRRMEHVLTASIEKNMDVYKKRKGKKKYREQKPGLCLFKKEGTLLIRTPVFLSNGLSLLFMLFLFCLVAWHFEPEAFRSIGRLEGGITLHFILIFMMGLLTVLNVICTTSFSREKDMLEYMRTQPVSESAVIAAKTALQIMVSLIQILVMVLILVFMAGFSPVYAALDGMGALSVSLLLQYYTVQNDYRKPKTSWKEPYELIKVNMNMLFMMAKSVGCVLLFGGAVVLFSLWAANPVLSLLVYGGAWLLLFGLLKYREGQIIKEKNNGIPYEGIFGSVLFFGLTYLAVQVLTGLAVFFVLWKANESLPVEELQSLYLSTALLQLLISQALTLGIFFLRLYLRGKRLFRVCRFTAVRAKQIMLCLLTGIGIYGLTSLLMWILSFLGDGQDSSGLVTMVLKSGGMWLNVLVIGITSPFVEEIIFRGLILETLKKKLDVRWAVLIQALLFGLYHLNWAQAVYGTVCGVILGIQAEKNHSLTSSFVTHCIFNGIGILAFVLAGA